MIKIVMALVCCECGKNEWVNEMNAVPGAQHSFNLEAANEYHCPYCGNNQWRLEVLVREKGGNGDGRVVTENP